MRKLTDNARGKLSTETPAACPSGTETVHVGYCLTWTGWSRCCSWAGRVVALFRDTVIIIQNMIMNNYSYIHTYIHTYSNTVRTIIVEKFQVSGISARAHW